MAYREKIYYLPHNIDHEYVYVGNYGAKGEKRLLKLKPTPEQIQKQNQANRRRYVRRLILANFDKGDLWITLKYPAGTRFSDSEVMKKDIKAFIRKLRSVYKKAGEELKYIYRLEIGKKGAPHIHILINRGKQLNTMDILGQAWKPGRFNVTPYEGEYRVDDLAKYITKLPEEEERQLSFFPEDDRKSLVRFQSSRNLIKPQPVIKEYKRRTLRSLVIEGPKPTRGYVIDKNSINTGTNPYTGMSWYRYTEIRSERMNI